MLLQSVSYNKSLSRLRSLRSAKVLTAGAIALSSIAISASSSSALSIEERYAICSKYPHNTQCEGYEIPIPLERRSGVKGKCTLQLEEKVIEDTCKVEATEQSINIYVETGSDLDLLEGKKATTAISVLPDAVSSLTYEVSSRPSKTLQAANALSIFGQVLQAAGGSYVTPRPMGSAMVPASKVNMQFAPEDTVVVTLESDDGSIAFDENNPIAETSADSDSIAYSSLVFLGDLEEGVTLHEDIQTLTGLALSNLRPEEVTESEERAPEAQIEAQDAVESQEQIESQEMI